MKIVMTRPHMFRVVMNAINASTPVAPPVTIELVEENLSRRAGVYDDCQISHDGHINVDIVSGRNIKLFIHRVRGKTMEDDVYTIYDDVPLLEEYQSWAVTYPDMLSLAKSVMADPRLEENEWMGDPIEEEEAQ